MYKRQLWDKIQKTAKDLQGNSGTEVVVGINYGGIAEGNRIALWRKVAAHCIEKFAYTPQLTQLAKQIIIDGAEVSKCDLILRTGETEETFHTSGFLPFVQEKVEWDFKRKLLPEITEEDLAQSIQKWRSKEICLGGDRKSLTS